MTGTAKRTQLRDHELIDREIERSMAETPATVHEIARRTGQHPTKVRRRFLELGWVHEGGRWVYKHNEGKV